MSEKSLLVAMLAAILFILVTGCARQEWATPTPTPTPLPEGQDLGGLVVNGSQIGKFYDAEFGVVCYYYFSDVTKHFGDGDYEFDFELSCVKVDEGD